MAPYTRNGMTAEQVRALINEEVRVTINEKVNQAMGEAIPTIITGLRGQIEAMMEERLAAFRTTKGNQGRARGFQYRDFSACNPAEFKGSTDPIASMRWIADIEGAFSTSGCPEGLKVRFARNLLKHGAKDWWSTWTSLMTEGQREAITWEEFVTNFRAKFVPRVEIEKMSRDFLNLEQTTETIPEMNWKFTEMALFCPQYAADENMRMTRYMDMLRTDIREFVCTTPYTSLDALMEAARRREIELETQAKKRKAAQISSSGNSVVKKQRSGDNRVVQRSSHSRNWNENTVRTVPVCYKCGKEGHLSRDCQHEVRLCFNCGKSGHIRAECPEVKSGIRVGHQGSLLLHPYVLQMDGQDQPDQPLLEQECIS